MEEELKLKKLLGDLKEQETLRKNSIDEINAEMERLNFREESEIDRFTAGMKEDIDAGLYNNKTEGQMQRLIDEQKDQIKDRYNSQKEKLNQNLEAAQKQELEDKANDYKQINSAIKEYHTGLIMESLKANKELGKIEAERDSKLQEIDKKIAEKQAQQTHMIMRNRNFMDIETTQASVDIRALGVELEELKAERVNISSEFTSKIDEQKQYIQEFNDKKERATKFLGQIRLSEKSIDEIYEILFDEEKEIEKENENEQETEKQTTEEMEHNEQDQTVIHESSDKEVTSTASATQTAQSSQQSANNTNSTTNTTKTTGMNSPSTSTNSKENKTPNTVDNNNKKFSYEFSVKGIKYDGQDLKIDTLLEWYGTYKEDIENAIRGTIGEDKEKGSVEDFLEYSDKLVYLSILSKAKRADDGKLIVDSQMKQRLEEYYKVWGNPKSQEESNMNITYDLKNISRIARFFRGSTLTNDDMANIKNNAFELRNRKNVSITNKGPLTRLEFKIKDMIENAREIRRLNKGPEPEQKVNPEEFDEEQVVEEIAKNVNSWDLNPEELKAADPAKVAEEYKKQQTVSNEKTSEEQQH